VAFVMALPTTVFFFEAIVSPSLACSPWSPGLINRFGLIFCFATSFSQTRPDLDASMIRVLPSTSQKKLNSYRLPCLACKSTRRQV